MSVYDFKVVKHPGGTRLIDVDDRDTSSQTVHLVGEPLKKGGSGGNFAIKLATGDPTQGSDEFLGIARKKSTEAAATDGTVEVVTPIPNKTVIRGDATTATNVNTAAKLLGLKLDWISIDLTSTTFTFDEDEGDDPNDHGFQIIGGDFVNGTLDCVVHSGVVSATRVGQTID